MSASVPRVHQELADLCACIIPGLQGSRVEPRTHTISPELWAALVTWNPSAPATGLGLRLAGLGRRRASFLDLIEEVPASVSLYVPSLTSVPVAAPVHPIAQAKVATDVLFGGRDELLVAIATWMAITDELLDDVPQLEAWVQRWLRWNVTLGEEKEVLTGPGTAGRIKGFYTRTPEIADVAGATVLAGVGTAFGAIVAETGLLPDGVVLPAATSGAFLTDAAVEWIDGQPTVLGMRICVSNFATKPLVGAFGAGAVLGRNGTAVVEGTQSHDQNFKKNISAIRAESRLTLGVMDPHLFRTVTVA